MTIALALFQPDIPQNTGTLLRLGACLGITVHVIHPTGFDFSSRSLKRAALDYLAHCDYREHESFAAFEAWCHGAGRRLVLLTTRASTSAYTTAYRPDDVLMVGRESAGVPETVAMRADLGVRIPMAPGLRSINVAVAASLVIGEAMRQTGAFEGMR
jgi:tRNA (cytidine/uridine-2'-O-)-methyltransferase